jgi:ubiquinone/menaquinone biosynthesis C-methylase UbiE
MSWENIFRKEGKVFYKIEPHLRKAEKTFLKNKVRKILDVGCGTGRHTVFLAKKFKMTGMDISRTGLRLTSEELKKKELKAKLIHASCYERFPFLDDSFDAVISTQVIHHNTHDKVLNCINEIHRVVKNEGFAFITMPYRKNQKKTRKKMLGKHLYVPVEGREKGVKHFIYTKKVLREDFHSFKSLSIKKDIVKGNYVILARK